MEEAQVDAEGVVKERKMSWGKCARCEKEVDEFSEKFEDLGEDLKNVRVASANCHGATQWIYTRQLTPEDWPSQVMFFEKPL